MHDHPCAITIHLVADDATSIDVKRQEGMVPVAIYGLLWAPASMTFHLALAEPGAAAMGTTARTYKALDDAAINLIDDGWTSLPAALGRKLTAGDWRIVFNAAETGGPFNAQIAWAPIGVD